MTIECKCKSPQNCPWQYKSLEFAVLNSYISTIITSEVNELRNGFSQVRTGFGDSQFHLMPYNFPFENSLKVKIDTKMNLYCENSEEILQSNLVQYIEQVFVLQKPVM